MNVPNATTPFMWASTKMMELLHVLCHPAVVSGCNRTTLSQLSAELRRLLKNELRELAHAVDHVRADVPLTLTREFLNVVHLLLVLLKENKRKQKETKGFFECCSCCPNRGLRGEGRVGI